MMRTESAWKKLPISDKKFHLNRSCPITLDCLHVLANHREPEWQRFRALMREHQGVAVPDDARPSFLGGHAIGDMSP
jgi:hypothetical protein